MELTNNENQVEGRIPDFIAYHVPERVNTFWTRIGAAWKHKDGKGLTLDLELVPLDTGRIVLRDYEPKEETDKEEK